MKAMTRPWLLMWIGVAAVLAAGALTVFAKKLGYGARNGVAIVPTDTVKRGPLTISVTVTGTIRSRQQEIIKSEVEGMPTVLYLIPEGTRVKKGDLLCELDVSKLLDQKISQDIVVQNADAAAVSAKESLAVAESQAQSDIAKAKLDYRFAKEDVVKYQTGDFPNLEKQANNKILLAEEEATLAKKKAEWSLKLFKEKYLSQTELDSDVLAQSRANSSIELARADMELLKKFTYKRQMDTYAAAIEQAAMALDRVERKAAADIVQAKATLKAKESELERQRSILAKVDGMITKAKMHAPTDGLVVYATTSGGGFHGDREPLSEGSTVRERQEIIHLPTADSVMAAVKVHESALDKVHLDLPVRVTVDAVPNKVFTGYVKKIAPLPDQQSMWQNPDLKVYNSEIWLEGDGSDLRTGMTCRAEIVVDYYPDALYVPVHAVVRVAGKPTVYVPGPDGLVPRVVEVGLDNNRMVHIKSGLKAGETVALAPPLTEAAVNPEEQAGQPPSILPTTRPGTPGRPGGMMPGLNATSGQGGRGGGGRGNMTPEQREEMRKRFEAMTPEQRQQMMEQGGRQRRGQGQGGRGAATQPAGVGQ